MYFCIIQPDDQDDQDDDKDDDGTTTHLQFVTDEQLRNAKVEVIADEGYLNALQQLADGTFVARSDFEYDLDVLHHLQNGKVEIQQDGIQYIISGLEPDNSVPIDNFDEFAAEVSDGRTRARRN